MNWGTKLTVGMILFMGFIVTLVIMMIKPHKADSLIDDDYYERGQTYDLDYNASRDAVADSMIPVVKAGENGLTVSFPQAVSYKVLLRHLANAGSDKTVASAETQKEVFIPANELKPGSWLMRIEYKAGQKAYLYQHKILLP